MVSERGYSAASNLNLLLIPSRLVVFLVSSRFFIMTGFESVPSTQGTSVNSDAHNTLCIHPSDSPGMVLVPVQFDGTGYSSWRKGVM